MLFRVFFMTVYCLLVIVWGVHAAMAFAQLSKLTKLRRIKKSLKRKDDEK